MLYLTPNIPQNNTAIVLQPQTYAQVQKLKPHEGEMVDLKGGDCIMVYQAGAWRLYQSAQMAPVQQEERQ